jgi:hypothetical protein
MNDAAKNYPGRCCCGVIELEVTGDFIAHYIVIAMIVKLSIQLYSQQRSYFPPRVFE